MNVALLSPPKVKFGAPIGEIVRPPKPLPPVFRASPRVPAAVSMARVAPEDMSKINNVVSGLVTKYGLSGQDAQALRFALASYSGQGLDSEIALLRRAIDARVTYAPASAPEAVRRLVAAYSQLQGLRDWKPDRINPYVTESLMHYAYSMLDHAGALNAARTLANTTEEAFLKLRPLLVTGGEVSVEWLVPQILEKAADLQGRGSQTPLQAAEEIARIFTKRQ